MVKLSFFEDYGEPIFGNYDMSNLRMDQAYLATRPANSSERYYLYSKHRECAECPYTYADNNFEEATVILSNVGQYDYRVSPASPSGVHDVLGHGEDYCEMKLEDVGFGEFGVYELLIEGPGSCKVTEIKEAVSIYFPILTTILIYLAITVCVYSIVALYKKYIGPQGEVKDTGKKSGTAKKRVIAIDTFRGISIAIMIFVNYGSGGYAVLDHAVWNGLHVADLVFPWFMWIMGACIPISLASSFKRGTSNKDLVVGVVKRSIKLFMIGIYLGAGSDLVYLRVLNVLQRFAITYLVVSLICIYLMDRGDPTFRGKFGHWFTDILKVAKGWACVTVILFVYCLILFLVAEEGCPKGYLGPGGLHKNMSYYHCTGGATGYIDRLILHKHGYQNPTSRIPYDSMAFDPEGILGNLPSIFTVFLGVQAGATLMVYKKHRERMIRWLSWGVVSGLIGGALCGFSKEDGVIPVNKNLWSLSFVLVTGSFAFFLLTFCYALIDVKSVWSGKPFLFAGMNAILMYIGHEMSYDHFPSTWWLSTYPISNTHFLSFFVAVWTAGFWVVVSYYLWTINYVFTV